MDNITNLMRIKEVADLLGVTTRTVYRRIWAGELPATKIGGLYYIKRADLDALLSTTSARELPTPQTELLKCAACLRVLHSPDQIGAYCLEPGCSLPICKDCSIQGIQRCREHTLGKDQKWAQALADYQAGKLPLLVKASQARLREINYLNRIRGRIAQIESLLHPQSNTLITIRDWERFLEQGDQRSQLLKLKGSILLDTRDAAEYPLNAWLHYKIPEEGKQKNLPLEIQVQVLSHLEPMAQNGFDTLPFDREELRLYLLRLNQDLEHEPTFRITVLAATTGWHSSVHELISPANPADAFLHPKMLIYLFDLESNQLIFHQQDQRLVQYAQLFKPLLIPEEAVEAQRAIENLLTERGHSSLTVGDALLQLPYPEAVIREAFKTMAASSRYRLLELDDIGTAIQQK